MVSNTNLSTQRVSAKAGSVRSLSSFQRPNDTTGYTDGDVIFDTTAAGVIQFDGVSVAGFIKDATIIMDEVDTVELELYVFDDEPTNLGDNAAFALATADLDKFVGVFTFDNSKKKDGGANFELYEADAHDPVAYTSTDGKLYGILVTRSTFTPTALTRFVLALHIEADQ